MTIYLNHVLGEGSCGGEYGGPLMFQRKEYGRSYWTQIGMVSWRRNGYCDQEGKPAVYTNIHYYMKWILDHLAPMPKS